MDILNFISWIKGKRIVTTVDPAKTVIPLGLKDGRRDDDYLAGTISVADFAAVVSDPSVAYVEGSFEPKVQATMTAIGGTITKKNGTVLKRYRIQGIADLTGSSTYALLIGIVSGSNTSFRVREDSVILAENTNTYDTVASAMNSNVLVANNAGNLISTTTAFIADDNTISTIQDHWYTLVMAAAAPFKAQVNIDFTIAIPEDETVEFFN
jgi:hypothetical protein